MRLPSQPLQSEEGEVSGHWSVKGSQFEFDYPAESGSDAAVTGLCLDNDPEKGVMGTRVTKHAAARRHQDLCHLSAYEKLIPSLQIQKVTRTRHHAPNDRIDDASRCCRSCWT